MDDLEGDYVEGWSDGYINAYDTYLPPSNDNPFSDCTLDGTDLEQFLTFPAVDKWTDFLPEQNTTHITMDESKRKQWDMAKDEINHIKKRWNELLNSEQNEEGAGDGVSSNDIILYLLGPDSKLGVFLRHELGISKSQAAYKISSTQLYNKKSLLKIHTPMSYKQYNEISEKSIVGTLGPVPFLFMTFYISDDTTWILLEKNSVHVGLF